MRSPPVFCSFPPSSSVHDTRYETQLEIDSLPMSSKGKNGRLSKEAIQTIGLVLREVLLQEPDRIPSIRKLAQQLGCNRGVIKKYWPEQYAELSVRTSTRWNEKTIAMARQELEKALQSPTPVPLKSVIRLIDSTAKTVRRHFPDLCKSIDSRYCERIDFEKYHKRLLEALTESGEPTSVTKLARELGCSYSLLLHRYPAECKQISERYGEARKKRAKERLLKIHEEIRQVILELHQQNIYPNSSQVGKKLKSPMVFIIPEVQEMWRMELAALGYPLEAP